MLIIISIIGMSSFIYLLLNQKITFQDCFFQILQKPLDQNIRHQGHLINRKLNNFSNNTLDIVILVWIVMSCILSLWFTSEMLTIYSTKRNIPLVQSLENICNKEELLVAGMVSLNDLAVYDKNLADKLKTHLYTKKDYPPKNVRMTEINDPHNGFYINSIIKDILLDAAKGRIVLLADTDYINNAFKYTRSYYNLIIAKNKYLPTYYANFISRYYPYRTEIILEYKIQYLKNAKLIKVIF